MAVFLTSRKTETGKYGYQPIFMFLTIPNRQYPFTLSESKPLRYFAFFYLYVMQGLPSGFALTAFTNYLTAKGASAASIGSFAAIVGLPWAFQFIWGPVIDRHQSSSMGRRKPWVLGAQFVAFTASLGLLFVKDPVHNIAVVSAAFLCHSIFASMQDASVDALAISVTPENERGRMNGFMRVGYLLGIGVGAAALSGIIKNYGFHYAALTQSGVLLIFMVFTFFMRERPDDALLPFLTDKKASPVYRHDFSYKKLFQELSKGLFSLQSVLTFGAILMIYLSISLFMRAYNYHIIRVLGWEDTSVSFMTGSYGMLVAIAIALSGGFTADKIGPGKLLAFVFMAITTYLLFFNSISSLWTNHSVARAGLVSLYFMDPGLSICAMPVLMSICRKNVEGSQFTTYMALVNFADIIGSYVSGRALTYVQAPAIGFFAGGLSLTALIIIFFVQRKYRQNHYELKLDEAA